MATSTGMMFVTMWHWIAAGIWSQVPLLILGNFYCRTDPGDVGVLCPRLGWSGFVNSNRGWMGQQPINQIYIEQV